MFFEDVNIAGPVTTEMEAKVDDHCLQLTLSYNSEDKSKYCTHYLNVARAKEFIEYLNQAIVEIEMELMTNAN